jgi:hypothetical protein
MEEQWMDSHVEINVGCKSMEAFATSSPNIWLRKKLMYRGKNILIHLASVKTSIFCNMRDGEVYYRYAIRASAAKP